MQISADRLVWNQATYTALQGHAVLKNAVLTLSPVTGELPGGSVTAQAAVDASHEPATESVSLTAPALALSPLLSAFRLPNMAEGTVQARLWANGAGDNLPAIAASLDGQLGLAMVNGVVDGAVVDRLFGNILQTVSLPRSLAGAQGPVAVRCMGLRIDALNGMGTVRAMTLDTSRLRVQGGGNINLGAETLGLILRPQMQMEGGYIGVPVEISGSFAAPTTKIAPLSAVQAAAQNAAGLQAGLAQQLQNNPSFLGQVARSLGIGSGGDVCPAALSLAQLGQPGPAAAPMTAAPATGFPPQNGPQNLLNTLMGK